MNKQFQRKVLNWSTKNLRSFPWRKQNITPYKIFVAEMLLKRTTAKAAQVVYPGILRKYPDITKLSTAKEKDLVTLVKPIGYYQRAKEMISASKFIVRNFGGKIPSDKSSLQSIPYVGDYTSGAILSLAFKKPFAMLDSNVNRIISRVFFGANSQPHITKGVRDIAQELVPETEHRQFNLAMLDLGGMVCLPKNPKCHLCPLKNFCKFYKFGI